MATADGSIIIETRVDTSGVKKGTNTIQNSVKGLSSTIGKLGAAIGIAFGVGAFIQFGRASIKASNDFENAMMGMQSVVEGQGLSLEKARGFIDSYIKDGLVSASDAMVAYKNLASRGYNTEQIEKVLLAFKESSTYGRQAALSQGEAIKGATEGIKNENSLLVDNAGVTKNVSKMWEEYAKSIGVGVQSLTKAQKIEAEVQGIMKETEFQMGDSAKAAGTFSGSISVLKNSMGEMQRAYGSFLKPIITAFIPVINSAVLALTRFFNMLAQVSALLFGKKTFSAEQAKEQESAVGGTVKNEKEFAKATDKTNKKLKNQTSGLDEINVLSQEVAESADKAGNISPELGGLDTSAANEKTEVGSNLEISPQAQKVADVLKALFEPFQDIDLSNLNIALAGLAAAVAPLGQTLFSGLEWAWKNIFIPLSEWVIEDALPAWLGTLTSSLHVLNSVLIAAQPLFLALWDNFLQPIAEWVGDKYIDWLNFFTAQMYKISDWFKSNQAMFDKFGSVIGEVAAALWKFIEPIADTVWETFKSIIDNIVDVVLDLSKAFIETATKIYEAWLAIRNFLDEIGVLDVIQAAIQTTITNIGHSFNMIVQIIGDVIKGVIENLGFFMDFIKAAFTGDWEAAWQAICNIFTNIFETIGKVVGRIWDTITSGFKTFSANFKKVWESLWKGVGNFFIGIWNGIVSAFESAVNWIIDGVNSIVDVLNVLIESAGAFLKKIGIDIELSIPNIPPVSFGKIPALARGAVIPPNKQFMAVLGDQKHGTNIEAPLDTLVDACNMANANNQSVPMLERMVELLEMLTNKPTTVELDGNEIGRSNDRYQANKGFTVNKGAFANVY